jgi:hypothetical protein
LKTYIELQEAKKISDAITRLLDENGFEKYQYQLDAVNQALNVIETYNGVIIADVVGLGKSVIASLIAIYDSYGNNDKLRRAVNHLSVMIKNH